MSYRLVDVVADLETAAVVSDVKELGELLNDEFGINIYHDLIVTSREVGLLKNALTALQVLAISEADEFLENLAESALNIFDCPGR